MKLKIVIIFRVCDIYFYVIARRIDLSNLAVVSYMNRLEYLAC
ncbi:MAG: hypothetical protein OEZ38_11680 [Gammaproteobacteria bacterium]|nr:hypothetical protein [Gammaproteobacteria bacterium]